MDVVGFDSETWLIKPGRLAPRLVCASFYSSNYGEELYERARAKARLVELLKDDDVLLVAHNAAFDFAVACAIWPSVMPLVFEKYEKGLITDTMLREMLQHIGVGVLRGFRKTDGKLMKMGYNLAEVAQRRLNIKVEKEDTYRLRYSELEGVHADDYPEEARTYAIGDAVLAVKIFLDQEADGKEYLEDEFRQARAHWWLHLMSCWGLRTDKAGIDAFEQELKERFEVVHARLVEEGLMRSNGSRIVKPTQERVKLAYEKAGKKLPLTPGGKPKTDNDTCQQADDEVLELYAEISSLQKQLGADMDLLRLGQTKPIQTRFDPLLKTGRTSSSPNVQNLPRRGKQRECFVPRAGNVFGAADYSQFELRTQAQICYSKLGYSNLREALNGGLDPHLNVAARILGISYEEAEKRKKAGDAVVDDARQAGKVANFGFPGGLGPRSFVHHARKQYGVIVTEEKAEILKAFWLETWPEFQEYFTWISNQVNRGESKIQCLYSNRWMADLSFTEACNGLYQALAAEGAKEAGFLIAKECYVVKSSPLYGCRPVNFVHDEFIVEVPENGQEHEAAMRIAELMVIGAQPAVPDVEVIAEPYLARRWSKKAKAVFKDGRLIPWDI